MERVFEKFVLAYIIKHGDVHDFDEATRRLEKIKEDELKERPPVATHAATHAPPASHAAPLPHPQGSAPADTVVKGAPDLGVTVHK